MSAPAADNTIAIHSTPNAELLARIERERTLIARFEEQKEVVKQTIAKGASDAELQHLFNLAARYGLDPFLKELWFVKEIGVFAGRDGFLKAARNQADFGGIRSSTVYDGDDFEFDAAKGEVVKHIIKAFRGNLLGAYAIVYRNGFPSVFFYAAYEEHKRGTPAWNQNKGLMILKVAEAHALKRQFGINGLEFGDSYDYDLDERETLAVINSSPSDDPYASDRPALGAPLAEEEQGQDPAISGTPTEAYGYGFSKWPKGEWFDSPSTPEQVKQMAIESSKRDIPEDLRRYAAHAVLLEVAPATINTFEDDPYSTKHFNKGQASLVIDFLKNAEPSALQSAIQVGQDIFNRVKEELS